MNPPSMPLFGLTDEHRDLVRSARTIFAAAGPAEQAGDSWRRLAASGFLGAAVPTDQGGLGLTCAEMALLTEEAGNLLLPGPVVESLWVGVPVLAAQQPDSPVLPAVLAGETYSVLVDQTLRGPELDRASFVVVPSTGQDLLLAADALGRCDAIATADPLERAFRLTEMPFSGGQRIDPPMGVGALALGRLGAAVYLNGITRWLLDETVRYTSQRRQFGTPIGSFQVIRHRLVDVHVDLEFARAACVASACLVDDRTRDAGTAVDCASVSARRAFELAHRHCLQAHGGMGFTWEHPLHHRLKRGTTIAARFGTRRELETALGRRLLEAAATGPRRTPPPPPI